ncbi:MAG: heparin lyase I family protein [Chitinophagales bacterium]
MRNLIFFFSAICFISCNTKIPEGAIEEFSDDFEDYTDASELVDAENIHWTEFNSNEINISTSPFNIDTITVHSGNQSVRFHCKQNDPALNEVCKCNLNKGNLYLKHGETIYFSAWYYLEHPTMDYGTFFVWDMEEIAAAVTGVRVMAWEENLEFERNKMSLPNIFQDGDVTLFPINTWTHLEMEIKLSQYDNGSVKLWLDDALLIDKDNIRTMPKDIITLAWGSQGYYDRIQVGITAKNSTEELVLYVDDVEWKKLD